ncbi:hypothetical protein [Janthinobacterium sp. PAMC25594]|uniref:hypothetical protein n=1 Tax=Janthinobacterium sp. PAMC25594 TaxID=2861284 RepID=UPI001C62F8D3|nr:hypothetical protein [Janthinobacterium sp. PAMC25594]QYG08068.1 hypothetical protein KY494_04515 [Janthinobacterium sp. PAMC25594]
MTLFDFEQGHDAMMKHYPSAPGQSNRPKSRIDAIIDTAVRLVMEEGLSAAESYLHDQGVSRFPPIPLENPNNLTSPVAS